LLQQLQNIRTKAEEMAKAITKEVEGSEASLETLPLALRERETQERVQTALSRSISLLSSPEVSQTIENLLLEEEANLSTLTSTPNPDENDRKSLVHTREKIATLEALRDLSQSPAEMEDRSYESLMGTLAQTEVPKTLREHALMTLCDNKSANGTKIKTKEVLDKLELLSDVKYLTSRIRSDFGTLRRWKERETAPKTIRKKDLALAVCSTPENLKASIKEDLKKALSGCLTPAPWKTAFNIGQKEVGDCNSLYLIASKEYANEPATKSAIKELHSKLAEIHKEAGGSVWVRAELLAKELREGSLKELEDTLLGATLTSKSPKTAIDYLWAFNASIGNRNALQRESIKTIKEEGTQKFDPIPLVAARIQTKIENLMEIGGYLKSVAQAPGALAETYIQQNLQERRHDKTEAWEKRLERASAKTLCLISETHEDLEDWKSKFNAIFDTEEDEEYTNEEIERRQSVKSVCQRKILQKEREIETLQLKLERLAELKATGHAINKATNAKELTEALRETKPSASSLSDALDQAFALAKSPTRLNLPNTPQPTGSASTLQMLEGAIVDKSIKSLRENLQTAADIIKPQNPEVASLQVDVENPEDVCRALKTASFKILKEIEMHLWEAGRSLGLAKEEQEEFLRENPELLQNRKQWVETLRKTEENMKPTFDLCETLPKKLTQEKRPERAEIRPVGLPSESGTGFEVDEDLGIEEDEPMMA
jgi:hypothetical protein